MPSLKRALLPSPVLFALCWLNLAIDVKGLLEGVSNECQKALYTFGKQHHAESVQALNADHMLYFLHIPRTAGRTYGACFLKQAWAPSRRCAKSYDVLRLNSSVPDCGLLSSHDDYSVVQYLPREAAVATQLRDPVDRVLSAYEFAIEVAARALVKDAPDKDPSKVDTQNVWPWSLLVPFIRQDLMRRAGDMHLSEAADPAVSPLDPYQNSLVMPLAEFIEHPLAHELIHNGQTLQVLGLTNYSHWKEAGPVRRCLQGSQTTQKLLSSLALKQLHHFVHVGVMDMLDESIETIAAQQQADEQAFVEQPSSQLNRQQTEPDSAFLQPGPLWESYRHCALRARRKNAARRTRSFDLLKLPDGRQVEQLNQMDVDLYTAGKQLLLKQREALRSAGQLQHLPQLSQNASKIHQRRHSPETQGSQGQSYPEQGVKLDMAKAKGCM
ncbi:MAG: tyrosine sulfotransferase-like [Trebouxia sp. A1-2]|nr:MAG: tyrosine sulfotransferase-like [Trebouxia sp. A1-2]